jgi:hypothetical protein
VATLLYGSCTLKLRGPTLGSPWHSATVWRGPGAESWAEARPARQILDNVVGVDSLQRTRRDSPRPGVDSVLPTAFGSVCG